MSRHRPEGFLIDQIPGSLFVQSYFAADMLGLCFESVAIRKSFHFHFVCSHWVAFFKDDDGKERDILNFDRAAREDIAHNFKKYSLEFESRLDACCGNRSLTELEIYDEHQAFDGNLGMQIQDVLFTTLDFSETYTYIINTAQDREGGWVRFDVKDGQANSCLSNALRRAIDTVVCENSQGKEIWRIFSRPLSTGGRRASRSAARTSRSLSPRTSRLTTNPIDKHQSP